MSFLLLAEYKAFDFAQIFKTVKSRWYYYIVLAVFVILLLTFFFIKKQPDRNSFSKTQKTVYVALLSALSAVCNIFDIPVSDLLQISLVPLIGFIAGYLLGGGYGFAVCFLGDLIGSIVFPHGPYNPIIGIGTGFWGLVPGVAFSYFKGNEYVKSAVSFVLGFLIVSSGINTLGFCLMYPTMYTFETLLPLLPFKLLSCAVNCALSMAFIKILPRLIKNGKTSDAEKSEESGK